MKVNIENAAACGSAKTKSWLLDELVKNLKELRDRTKAGDMAAIDEFFDLFKFNDSDKTSDAPRPVLTGADRYALVRDLVAKNVVRVDMYKFPWERVTDLDKLTNEAIEERREAA